MDWEREQELRDELDFRSLYDTLRDAVVAAYDEADSGVYSFASQHDVETWDVWQLIRDEASSRGDDALASLVDSPLDRHSGGAVPGAAAAAAAAVAVWAWNRWTDRRRR